MNGWCFTATFGLQLLHLPVVVILVHYVLCQSQIATPEKEVTCVTGVCVVRSSENVQRVGLRVAMVHAFE